MREFKFNTNEKELFGDNLLGAAKVVNTANTINGIVYNNLFGLDQQLTDIGVASINALPIMYKNLHGMDIDTSLLDGYTYSDQSTVSLMTASQEEVRIDYILAMEFSTIPYQEVPGIPEDQQPKVKDDSLALSLRVAVPQGSLAWCKENQVNPYAFYGQVVAALSKDLQKDLFANFMNQEMDNNGVPASYKFDGSIGSEE